LKDKIKKDFDKQIAFLERHKMTFSRVSFDKVYVVNGHFVILDPASIANYESEGEPVRKYEEI
jgi:hypothetical protein